jgi:hypothetical protein
MTAVRLAGAMPDKEMSLMPKGKSKTFFVWAGFPALRVYLSPRPAVISSYIPIGISKNYRFDGL